MKENEAELAAAVRQIKGVNVNDSDIHAHVMLPPHLLGAFSDRGKEDVPISHHLPGRHNELNVQGFISAIESALTNLCAGYSLRLRQNGVTTLATANWNWAKQPLDGSESWTPDVRANVASLSKIVTAIAMTKLLNDHGMSYDTPIIDFLPEYWIKGPNVNEITFAQLMTHKSGLAFNIATSQSDFQFMKQQVAAGTTYLGQFYYQNMNFGLCRILTSTINGNIAVDSSFPFDNDELWDSSTLSAYQAYVNSNLFSPSGVTGATLYHEPADALAYTFPVSGNGWNSGDLTFQAGGNGWHMTVDQFLALMSTFRYSGAIMSQEDAQTLLGNNFGIDFSAETSLGPYYAKLGGLSHCGGYMEQSIAFYLPRQMELVVFVNSPIGVALPGQLLSYSDTGFSNNLLNPVVVGLGGWGAFRFLFGGRNVPGEDRIYAVNEPGQLLSYGDAGTYGNVSDPVIVGLGGWGVFKFLFAGRNVPGEDRIYAVTPSGQLWSYGDAGTHGNVSDPVIVGLAGWEVFTSVFAGKNAVGEDRIYAVTQPGQLWSYGDAGTHGNVSDPVIVGSGGWEVFTSVFAGSNASANGRIYAVTSGGQLQAYSDNGTTGNVANPMTVGSAGWTDFQFLFTGENDRIYGVLAPATAQWPGQSLYTVVSSAYENNIFEI